jgi:hypothetical protein
MHVNGPNAYSRSHIHMSMFLTQHCYWLIINCSCTLSHNWSSYTTMTEEWTHRKSRAAKPNFGKFFMFFFMSHRININIKYTKENHHTFPCPVNIILFFMPKQLFSLQFQHSPYLIFFYTKDINSLSSRQILDRSSTVLKTSSLY